MNRPALVPVLDNIERTVEWDAEEKTPVETETLLRWIGVAVRRELRPLRRIAVAIMAAMIAMAVELAFIAWGPGG